MKFKRITAFFLAFVIITSLIVPNCSASEASAPVISVQSVCGLPGSTVNVNITISNNPGVLGATLTFSYDPMLTLVSASEGDAFSPLTMTKPGGFTSPCNFFWDGQELSSDDVKNGTILSLQFLISEEAEPKSDYEIMVSYEEGDIVDSYLKPVDVVLVNGKVSVISYVSGDLNDDTKVNSTDVILLRRDIAGGYDQTINEKAADVNEDSKKNSTDVILMRRFIAGGYDITLPYRPACLHDLEKIEYMAPTGTKNGNIEYWRCTKCGKYYSDANGTKVISADSVIIKPSGNIIVYDLCNNDAYLKTLDIQNPNPSTYSSQNGLTLKNLSVDGYFFKGWFTAQTGGIQVTEIKAGTTGEINLYAQWVVAKYTIHFACDMVYEPDVPYTPSDEVPLPKPELDKYTFVGWTDKEGKMWDTVPFGTMGNLTFYANWSSNRNQAKAIKKLSDPIICEDSQNGVILFSYEIGTINNVPLFTTLNLKCANGLITTVSQTGTDTISNTSAETVSKSISKATTNSSTWTLSNEWNNTTEVSQSYLDENKISREEAEVLAKSENGSYNLSRSNGGSSSVVENQNGTFKISENQAHSTTDTQETGQDFKLSVDADFSYEHTKELSSGISAGLTIPLKVGEAVLGANLGSKTTKKIGFDIGLGVEYSNYVKNTSSGTNSWADSMEYQQGYSNTSTNEKTWNTLEGYSQSNTVSRNNSIADSISKLVSEQKKYGSSYAEGVSDSHSQEIQTNNSNSDEFSSTLTYFTSHIDTNTISYSSTGNTHGDYRMVEAGTVHVFAVVGYDITNQAYFVYTYNILDDKTESYLDYSWDGTFNDYETGVVPFEVPYFVNQYVNSRVAKTDGLLIDPDTGIIEEYEGNEKNEIIIIPSYISIDNNDGERKFVKVKGIKPGLFKGNTNIVGVSLGNFITKIPDGTFDGCTSLKEVFCPNVTEIGEKAFSKCVSLNNFDITPEVTSIGKLAFDGAKSVTAITESATIAMDVSRAGADNVILDISGIPMDDRNDMYFEIGNISSFELRGKGNEFPGLAIKSDAKKTVINGINFVDCKKTPLTISSENVVLDNVNINCPRYALVLTSPSTNVTLNTNNKLISTNGKAVVCGNINLSQMSGSSVIGRLTVSGDVLVCGEISGENYLIFSKGEVIKISEDEFGNFAKGILNITFDAVGGTVSQTSGLAYYGSSFGDLPVPERTGYGFEGWFTEKNGGNEVTKDSIVNSVAELTLYAHWTADAYTLSYNANGGTGAPSAQSKYHDVDLTISSTIPTRTGYTFKCWSWSLDGSGLTYKPGDAYKENKTWTLDAQWTPNSYTITFDGSGGTPSYSSGNVTYDNTFGILPTAQRTGFTFNGWYTSEGNQVTSDTKVSKASAQTLYARWLTNAYTVTWNSQSNCSISVRRTSSPFAGASTGTLNSGNTVFFGDTLSISYSPASGYSLSNYGSTSLTVSGNVNSNNIYANISANRYTYNIVYRSTNGTSLGSDSVTYSYGTTNTVYPKGISGYTSPSAKTVAWDSTSSKTITFDYSPVSVASSQNIKEGAAWWLNNSSSGIFYTVNVETQNRTASSIQVRVKWKNYVKGVYYGWNQFFSSSIGGVSTGQVKICGGNYLGYPNCSSTAEVYSGWVTVPISASQTSLSISANWWDDGGNNGNFTESFSIQAY